MTRNENKQQQDAKNGVKLKNKWTKVSWKNFEKAIRRGRNRFIKA